jgi:hypothetical protein
MTPRRYVSVPHELSVLTWPEDSPADFEAMIGAENVNAFPGGIQVRNDEGEWFTLRDGWAVSLDSNGIRSVESRAVIGQKYRPA